MAELRLRGEAVPAGTSRLPLPGGTAPVRQTVRVAPAARAEGAAVAVEASPRDLVEVELENGVVFWTCVEQLQEDASTLPRREVGADELPTRYPQAATTQRGEVAVGVGVAIKTLKILDVDLPREAASWAAARIESKLAGPPGFYRIDERGELGAEPVAAGSEPVLVFLHGTASSTRGAFAGLTERPETAVAWRELQQRYRGRIFGFEHRTLTESPLTNALQILEALPEQGGPPLHLVSHSRGGLVGELLCHGGLAQAFPAALLEAAGVEEERSAFARLNELLARRANPVDRFVRVACPAGGTTLASRRLDIYFSLLVHVVGMVPVAGPLLEALGELLAAVAKERTRPEVLPGLAAQMPKAPLIRVLNGSDRQLTTDLTVIAGDSDGLLKNLANLFYWRTNDLVVDTRSMYRGAARTRRRWFRAEGRDVHHCNYFARSETVRKLVDGLTRAEGDDAGFSTARPRAVARATVANGDPRENPSQATVILLPGMMGSHLSVRTELQRTRVWLDLSQLMKGRVGQLAVTAGGPVTVVADGVLECGYGAFAAFLRSRGQHVLAHAYDWRLSLADAAQGLGDLVRSRLEASGEPIRIVGHSMGGLVARLMIAREPALWQEVVDRGGRLVQLGTPNGGTYLGPVLLRGETRLLRRLAAVDRLHDTARWVELFAGFPGLLEMAPRTTPERDFFKVGTWNDLRVLAAPSSHDLAAARKVAAEIAGVDLARHPVVYVAGRADETPTMLPTGTVIGSTHRGDGRVTWDSGIPPGVAHWFVDARHGNLADHQPAFDGLLDLVLEGKTVRLPTAEPPVRKRRGPGRGALATEEIEVFPTQESLEAAALGMADEEPWAAPDEERPQCTVRVVHGDLSYAMHPVMVGHYAGDPILSAEAVLDRRLGGVLSARHLLGLYPGAAGSHEVILRPDALAGTGPRPGGALVVGLGEVGSLTPGALTRSVEEAVVRYVRMAQESPGVAGAARQGLGLASLFIGSGEAGLSLEQVIRAILLGVRLANQRVRRVGRSGEGFPGVDRLELLELYEDRALQALHTLRHLARLGFDDFDVVPTLEQAAGQRRRASFREPGGWWVPLTIREGRGGRLELTASGQRALTSPDEVQIQPELIGRLLASPLSSSSPAHRRLSETLFELLLPHRLKKGAAERQNVLLIVDEAAARYPWELLTDRLGTTRRPAGVDAGLVRQLRLRNTRTEVSHPASRQALVVGDPPSGHTPLPGAQEEASRVADLLARRSWSVVRQIRGDIGSEKSLGRSEIDAESVLTLAMTGDARILHLAGHGVYQPNEPTRSGMVIGGGPLPDEPLVLLSPAEVAQMRLVPELVFVNCCHLGRIQTTPPHLLAANLATQFIGSGVRAVVAAGWAVDDEAALTFAETFYAEMFRGRTFGEAVLEARRRTWSQHPESNTWAAYQCYGDPGFRLMMDLDVRERVVTAREDDYVDPVEVVVELYNLVGRAKCEKSDEEKERLEAEIAALAEVARLRGWGTNGEIHAGLGRAYAEIADFERAVLHYDEARATPDGTVTLRDLEQLANLRARRAADRVKAETLGREEAEAEIRTSIAELESLSELATTSERWAMLGSAYKRLVQVAGAPDATGASADARAVEPALRQMATAYGRAAAAAPSDLYAAINALAAILLLGGPWAEPAKEQEPSPLAGAEPFDRVLEEVVAGAAQSRAERHFWSQSYAPDAELLAALRRDQLGERLDELADRYRTLFRDYGSRREHASVLDQLELLAQQIARLAAAAASGGPGATKQRLQDQAGQLQSLLVRLGQPRA